MSGYERGIYNKNASTENILAHCWDQLFSVDVYLYFYLFALSMVSKMAFNINSLCGFSFQ